MQHRTEYSDCAQNKGHTLIKFDQHPNPSMNNATANPKLTYQKNYQKKSKGFGKEKLPLSPKQLPRLKRFARIGFEHVGAGILTWLSEPDGNYRQLYYLGRAEMLELLSQQASSITDSSLDRLFDIDWSKTFIFAGRNKAVAATILMPVDYDRQYECCGIHNRQILDRYMKIKSGGLEATISISD